MNDIVFSLIFAFGGAILAAHCSRMTWREIRTGVAKAQHGDYPRSARPVAFWTIIVINSLAASLGAALLLVGLFILIGVAR